MAVLNLVAAGFVLVVPQLADVLVADRSPTVVTSALVQGWFCAAVLVVLAVLLLRTRWALARPLGTRSARRTRTTALLLAGTAVAGEIVVLATSVPGVDPAALLITLLLVFIVIMLCGGLSRAR